MIRRFSLLPKLLTVNALIIVLVAAGGVWAARYFNDTSVIACAVLLGIGGSALSAMTGYAMIKNHFQTLREFRKSVEAIQGGMSSSIAAGSDSDPTIGGVIRSVHDAIGRLEDESLWHTTQLLNSIEAERQRIGRELHDQTCQTLATALIDLKLADNLAESNIGSARERLAAAKQLIEHSLEQIKICVYDLRPVMLDDLGLVPTLHWHIKTHLGGSGLTVVSDFEEAAVRAPRKIETTLYRVAQEALSNVVRHARASRVTIRLEIKREYAVMVISDNGQGFNPENDSSEEKNGRRGLGLHTIRERIKLAKGTLNIVSEKGMGTQINVVLPMPPQYS